MIPSRGPGVRRPRCGDPAGAGTVRTPPGFCPIVRGSLSGARHALPRPLGRRPRHRRLPRGRRGGHQQRACRPSPLSACRTGRYARAASASARRWPTPATSSRCSASPSTSPRPTSARTGSGLDLPIALGVLVASGQLPDAGARRASRSSARSASRAICGPFVGPSPWPLRRGPVGAGASCARGQRSRRPRSCEGLEVRGARTLARGLRLPRRRCRPASSRRRPAGSDGRAAPRGLRLRRRPRPGRRQARPRGRRRRRPQRAHDRPARGRQDHARPPAPHHPPGHDARRGARDHQDPQRRRSPGTGPGRSAPCGPSGRLTTPSAMPGSSAAGRCPGPAK